MTRRMKSIRISDSVSEIPFNEKGMTTVNAGGTTICLIRNGDHILACTDRCPHAGASLSDGFIDQHNNIVCPVHHYKFNLRTGRDAFNEGYFLKLFPVQVRGDGVYVEIGL